MHLYPILLQYVINGLMVLSEVVTVPRESNHIRIRLAEDVKNLDGSIPGPYPDDGEEGGGHQDKGQILLSGVRIAQNEEYILMTSHI